MEFNKAQNEIVSEIKQTFENISADEVNALIEAIEKADKVFFVAVGRVLLSLKSFAKRLAHIGVDAHIVGDITEPAITENDFLIVGSGSGESSFPLIIAKKAKSFNATVAHIGSNPNSTMSNYSDYFVRIPVQTKLGLENETKSVQPMTSLFEQSLLLLGDTICLMMIDNKNIDMPSLWEFHANLE